MVEFPVRLLFVLGDYLLKLLRPCFETRDPLHQRSVSDPRAKDDPSNTEPALRVGCVQPRYTFNLSASARSLMTRRDSMAGSFLRPGEIQ